MPNIHVKDKGVHVFNFNAGEAETGDSWKLSSQLPCLKTVELKKGGEKKRKTFCVVFCASHVCAWASTITHTCVHTYMYTQAHPHTFCHF